MNYFYQPLSWLICKKSISSYCPSSADSSVKSSKPLVSGNSGVVVSSQHLATDVGLDILKRGGNAIDASVAVGYALAVTDPCCGNLGGGGFMLIHFANGKNTFLNFREKAPFSSTKDMFLDKKGQVIPDLSTKGYLAVGVPGTVKGLDQALSKYGSMSREQVMAPAIKLASNGFILQSGDVDILNDGIKKFSNQENVTKIFLNKSKKNFKSGDRLVQKNLANSLSLISKIGQSAFYEGSLSKQIVAASKINNGILSQNDFARYTVKESEPVVCSYRDYTVLSSPLPGGGTTLCQMLNILEGYKLSDLGFHTSASLHFMLSSMLYAYSDRNSYLGDPDFVNNPSKKLLSKAYAAHIRSKILKNKAESPQALSTQTTHEGTNTTHFSIQDKKGNTVSLTYTLNSYFGAGVIAGNTGIILNNEMDDFAVKPGVPNSYGLVQGEANQVEPGKRPLSSMAPTIVLKSGKPILITGSPGGSTIPTTVLQVITNITDFGMDIRDAVCAPRVHFQGQPNFVITEPYALKPKVVGQLWAIGYRVVPFMNWGSAESIYFQPSGLKIGANDCRKVAGKAAAY